MIELLHKAVRRSLCLMSRQRFAKCGRNAIFDALTSTFSYDRVYLGDTVFIGPYAYFRTTHGKIKIGDNVLFGPNVYILGGNHIFDIPGQFLTDVRKSDDHIDSDVVIKNDVWIGARATILSGVTVHEGSIIAAGCIVTSDVPAYEIHGGVPNRKLKDRFTPEALEQHKHKLNKAN